MTTPLLSADVIERIDAFEERFRSRESVVQAFLPEADRFDRLRHEAAALLARYPRVEDRPPLFCMLIGVKDIFRVDGFETHAGSRLPAEALGGPEARSVTRLRDAGALIAGKTVTTEFAYFSPGPTTNPHNPKHTPGGSSSGSAAAVAAGLCDAALGTQTIGSVVRPASFCGVFGLKPTYERVSRENVIPLSPSFDHVGLFAPDAGTAARIAPALYEAWDANRRPDSKPVLGLPEGAYLESAPDSARAWFGSICASLAEAGYELRRIQVMADYAAVRARHDRIMAAEAASVHREWFDRYEDLYAPKTAELIKRGRSVSDAELDAALRERDTWRNEMDALMSSAGIDLWISPSTLGPAPEGLESTGDPVMNLAWTQAGLPAANLPAGVTEGRLPLGLQITGRRSCDEALLHWAGGFEKALGEL